MKVLIAADIVNNKILVNNIYNLKFIGEIIIEYSNEIIYKNEIELNDMVLWYSPFIKMINISKIKVILREKNGNMFYSTTPIVYLNTFMRTGNSELIDLCNFIKNDGCIVNNIVEIGSFEGESTTIFSENFTDSKIFAVDIWTNNYDESESVINSINPKDIEDNFDIISRDFPNIIKIKMSSERFSTIVADNSIDFVYIDGDHSYKGLSLDINKWRNKVKRGGYIGGHDYVEDRKDLIRAINENFYNYKINIFGWSWLIKL
jgi:hypothetical protein